MAEFNETVLYCPPSSNGDLNNKLPCSLEEIQTESNYLGIKRIEGPSIQEQVAIEDNSDLQQRLGNGSGSHAQAAGPVTLNATLLAQEHHTNYGVEEKILGPGIQSAKRKAPTRGKSAQDKRSRQSNWDDDEKATLLVLKLRFLVICMMQFTSLTTVKLGKSNWFHYVAEETGRAFKSCQGQWDSLLKSYNAIRDHEWKISSGMSSLVHFWQMKEHEKQIANEKRHIDNLEPLPKVFPRAWYELMVFILQIDGVKKNLASRKGTRSIKVDPNLPSSSTQTASTITDPINLLLGPMAAIRSRPSSSHDQVRMIPPLPLISSTQDSPHAEDEILGMDESDDLISRIAPFVNKQIEEAVRPFISELQGNRKDEEEHRDKILAFEVEKLALKRMDLIQFIPRGGPSMENVVSYAQAGVANSIADRSLAHGVQHKNYYPPSGVIQQPNPNADLNIIFPQGGVANSTADRSLAYGEQHTYYHPPSGVIQQPNPNADLRYINHAQAGMTNYDAKTSLTYEL